MYKYGQEGKKIVFVETDKRHADLIIRLRHDGLSQLQFFQSLVSGYIEKDKRIIDFIEEVKRGLSKQGKDKIKKTKDLLRKGYDLEDVFDLNEKERKDIFDVIAQEFPDL